MHHSKSYLKVFSQHCGSLVAVTINLYNNTTGCYDFSCGLEKNPVRPDFIRPDLMSDPAKSGSGRIQNFGSGTSLVTADWC